MRAPPAVNSTANLAVCAALAFSFTSLALSGTASASRIEVSATLEPQPVQAGWKATLSVSISGAYDRYQLPEPGDAVERSEKPFNQQSTFMTSSGLTRREQSFKLYVWSQQPGRHELGRIEVFRGDQVVARSEPLVLEVIPRPPDAPRPPRLALETARLTRWVGEAFPVELVLLASPRQSDLDVRAQGPWRQTGHLRYVHFESVRDAPWQERAAAAGTDDRQRPLATRTLTRMQLIAEGPGETRIDTGRYPSSTSLFDSGSPSPVPPASLSLHIRALPEEGRPAGFRDGNVGVYRLQMELESVGRPVRVGDTRMLTATVAGTGNLTAVHPPEVAGDAMWTVSAQPGSMIDDLQLDKQTMTGKRVFRYQLTARQAGVAELPRAVLTTFDPERGAYVTVSSQPDADGSKSAAAAPARSAGATSAPARPPARVPPWAWGLMAGLALLSLALAWRWRAAVGRLAAGQI